jgi:hypothetical protein
MTPEQNAEWWLWVIIIIGLLACAGWVWIEMMNQRNLEHRRYGRCAWLGCKLPATGGEWTAGVRYCRTHYDYLTHGLEEPLT